MIIDASADLNEAVTAVRTGAFSRAGQSPFACQFAIGVDTIFDAFLDRLVETTNEMTVGDPRDPGTDMGFISDAGCAAMINAHIEHATSIGRIANDVGRSRAISAFASDREYVMPHVLVDMPIDTLLSDTTMGPHPAMGPVVHVLRATAFDEAIDMVHAMCDGGSFAGVFSRKPSNIEKARRNVRTGIVSINAPFHMPRIARQTIPMSGRGSASYLRHFVYSKVTTENTMRRGFAPDM
jgi:RHH-type proline utilization regulon transcriptional repressor/proline dehydrogenase/delta 1-pyrroline-5-carboxylate dehydrogenase